MQSNPYDHIAIIGTGLIGGSLARLIRHHYPDTTLTGVSRRLAAAKDAVKQGVLDYGHDSVSDIAPNVDMAIVCTPIDTIPATTKILFEKGIPLVSDIGSTKSHIAAHPDCRPIQEHQLFVPAHPMAGNELRGFENSTAELLKGCRYLVCPPESNTPNAAYDKFVSWLKTMDFTVIEISPEKTRSPGVHGFTSSLFHGLCHCTRCQNTGGTRGHGRISTYCFNWICLNHQSKWVRSQLGKRYCRHELQCH